MKRKPSDHEILTALQKSRPSADPAFVQALKQKLFNKAEDVLRGPHVSRLSLILIAMRRYTFAYVAALLLVAITGIMVLPRGINTEEFLAKASENYEGKLGLLHEERLHQRFENGELIESSLDEWWMDENGNALSMVRNPDTKEILQVDLTVVNENGETVNYVSSSMLAGMELDEWDRTLAGGKYYCAQVEVTHEAMLKAFLTIAEEDPSVYTMSGESSPINELEPVEGSTAQLLSPKSSSNVVSGLLKQWEENGSGKARAYPEEPNYIVFEQHAEEATMSGTRITYFYFNKDSYQLEKQKISTQEDADDYELTTYLAHEYLTETDGKEIFDPSLYDVEMSGMLNAGGPEFIVESGCYYEGIKLSEEEKQNLLNGLPEGAVEEWNDLFLEITQEPFPISYDLDAEQDYELGSLSGDFPLLMPSTGNITQAFHASHPAIDLANRDRPDVVASADGIVTHVSQGNWNGGYGTDIWIEHSNGYRTHYAHLGSVAVKVGDGVTQGQIIGEMGNTGRVYGLTGIFLHFELEKDGIKVNPMDYFIKL